MTHESTITREVFFLNTPTGARFSIGTYPVDPPVGGLLYLHPFAEEMNKSRRMASLSAQAFAEHGWVVLQIDMAGCGDSAGDFADADWQRWLEDVSYGWAWLRERCEGPHGIWTLRAGSLLVADWLEQHSDRPPLVLWQPVGNGQQHLTQFLRLKAVSEAMGNSSSKGVVARLRTKLDANREVEVAGYGLSPALAAGLAAATLRLPENYDAQVAVLELVSGERTELSPGTARLICNWREGQTPVVGEIARGPSFWQTQEIETAPRLISASLHALDRLLA